MDVPKILDLLRSMEDGALEPEEAKELLGIMVRILDLVKPNLKKRWAKILLIGISGTLEEKEGEQEGRRRDPEQGPPPEGRFAS